MKQFNPESTRRPYIISGGNILLDDEIKIVTSYPSFIKLTELKDLFDELKSDEQGMAALLPRRDEYDIDEVNLQDFRENIDARRELLGLIMVDVVGIPVDRLSDHQYLVDGFCAQHNNPN